MNKDTAHETRPTDEPAGIAQRGEGTADATPPPDHADFVKVRSAGLRAVRENLARRRKVPGS